MTAVSKRAIFRSLISNYILLFITEFVAALLIPMLTILFFKETKFLFENYSLANISYLYAALLLITQLANMFSNVFVGFLSDYVNRKFAMSVCYIGYLVQVMCCIVAIKTGLIIIFFIGTVIGGLTMAIRPICTAYIIANAPEKNRFIFTGLIQFFIGIGFILGPMLTYQLLRIDLSSAIPNVVYPYIFSVIILVGVIVWVLFSSVFQNRIVQEKTSLFGYLSFLKNKNMWFLFLLLILNQLIWGTFYQYVPAIGKHILGFDNKEITYFYSLLGFTLAITTVIVLPVINYIFPAKGKMILGVLGFIVANVVAIISLTIRLDYLIWYAEVIILMSDLLVFISLTVAIAHHTPKQALGLSMGIIYTFGAGASWGVGAIIGGILFPINPILILYACLAISLVLGVLILYRQDVFIKTEPLNI